MATRKKTKSRGKDTETMQALRTRIDTLIAGGSRATRTKQGEGIILRGAGRGFTVLMTPAGQVTRAGKIYEDRVGEPLPAGGYDANQTPHRVGNVEYIKTRGGKDRAVRRWDPSSDKFVYTALGKNFYAKRQSEYVVEVPVNIRGKRENGTEYHVKGFMPIKDLGLENLKLPQNLTEAERDERIKLAVARFLTLDAPLYEVSQETWRYDPHGTWKITELRTSPAEAQGGNPRVRAETRTVGAGPASLSQLLYSDAICAEAFVDHGDGTCLPRQMAHILRIKDVGALCTELDGLLPPGRDGRYTSAVVLAYAKKHKLGYSFLFNNEILESSDGQKALPLLGAARRPRLLLQLLPSVPLAGDQKGRRRRQQPKDQARGARDHRARFWAVGPLGERDSAGTLFCRRGSITRRSQGAHGGREAPQGARQGREHHTGSTLRLQSRLRPEQKGQRLHSRVPRGGSGDPGVAGQAGAESALQGRGAAKHNEEGPLNSSEGQGEDIPYGRREESIT